MVVDGLRRDDQPPRDLGVAHPSCEQRQHLELACGQAAGFAPVRARGPRGRPRTPRRAGAARRSPPAGRAPRCRSSSSAPVRSSSSSLPRARARPRRGIRSPATAPRPLPVPGHRRSRRARVATARELVAQAGLPAPDRRARRSPSRRDGAARAHGASVTRATGASSPASQAASARAAATGAIRIARRSARPAPAPPRAAPRVCGRRGARAAARARERPDAGDRRAARIAEDGAADRRRRPSGPGRAPSAPVGEQIAAPGVEPALGAVSSAARQAAPRQLESRRRTPHRSRAARRPADVVLEAAPLRQRRARSSVSARRLRRVELGGADVGQRVDSRPVAELACELQRALPPCHRLVGDPRPPSVAATRCRRPSPARAPATSARAAPTAPRGRPALPPRCARRRTAAVRGRAGASPSPRPVASRRRQSSASPLGRDRVVELGAQPALLGAPLPAARPARRAAARRRSARARA